MLIAQNITATSAAGVDQQNAVAFSQAGLAGQRRFPLGVVFDQDERIALLDLVPQKRQVTV